MEPLARQHHTDRLSFFLIFVSFVFGTFVAVFCIGSARHSSYSGMTRVKEPAMSISYSAKKSSPSQPANEYGGAISELTTSSGVRTVIPWKGPVVDGLEAVDVLRATLQHLQHVQKTDAALSGNEKLIFRITQALDEAEGMPTSLGGELNKFIPKKE